jgi:hypothetical protein
MKTIHQLFIAIVTLIISTSAFAEVNTDQSKQTRISQNGHYNVTVTSWLKPLRLGRMHAWEAQVSTTDGKPVTDAKIKVGGGMPIHNHGFPTQPEVTKQLKDGVYLIEGDKFSMRGPWIIFLDITSNNKTDSVAFDINM